MKGKYYAVRKGRNTGIFNTWEECKKQINGFKCAEYKSFTKYDEAVNYIDNKKEDINFEDIILDENNIIAYVDGSFNGGDTYAFGIVLITYNGNKEISKSITDAENALMRNVAGEISGSMYAMNYAYENEVENLYIFYDYAGIEKWCSGEWKTNKNGTRKYKEFYDEISKKVKVHFVKVKGHSNDHYNDLADKLAKRALGIG